MKRKQLMMAIFQSMLALNPKREEHNLLCDWNFTTFNQRVLKPLKDWPDGFEAFKNTTEIFKFWEENNKVLDTQKLYLLIDRVNREETNPYLVQASSPKEAEEILRKKIKEDIYVWQSQLLYEIKPGLKLKHIPYKESKN